MHSGSVVGVTLGALALLRSAALHGAVLLAFAFSVSESTWASTSGWDLELIFPESSPNAHFLTPRDLPAAPITVWPATRAESGWDEGWGMDGGRDCLDSNSSSSSSSAHSAPKPPWLRLGASVGTFPGGKLYPLGQPFETFRGNWGSMRLSPEQGLAYSEVPPAASLALAYAFNPHVFAYMRASLKRDLRAWHEDPLGGNWPISTNEIELNEPSLGYLVADASWGRAILGRFPLHMGPSPEFSLLVGGQKPAHDALLLSLKAPAVRYHFAFAGLNTWLQGTPTGDTSSFDYPVGSEAWRQRHYAQGDGENAHLRVYDARAKSLNVHRLEAVFGSARAGGAGTGESPHSEKPLQTNPVHPHPWGLTIAISEMQIIGGKVPDLRDVQPFAVWHNDFKYGYTNNLVHLDFRLDYRLPSRGSGPGAQGGATDAGASHTFALFGELALDDLPYAPKEGEEQKAITGWLLGLEHAARWGAGRNAWMHRLHVVKTDPRLYHFAQPYNTYFARQILNTNVQPASDPNFIDRLVIDYPVGYLRGGDAYDFWYRGTLHLAPGSGPLAWLPWLRRGASITLKLAYLQHGEITEATLPQDIDVQAETPSGTPLEEWRGELAVDAGLTRTLTLQGGAGARRWQIGDVHGEGNGRGADGRPMRGNHFWGQVGLVWRWGNGL
jgi:hypothetical protein